jgi:hypothetical protein
MNLFHPALRGRTCLLSGVVTGQNETLAAVGAGF